LLQRHAGIASATFAIALLGLQLATIRHAPGDIWVRIVLPATIAGVPLALWHYRTNVGVWVLFVGLGANLAAILANGGLMPIEQASVAEAVGAERAAGYEQGEWIAGSKDVLLAPGAGRLTELGDQIVVRLRGGGMVVSPGDVVVWCGLLILVTEASISWQRRTRREGHKPAAAAKAAEGGAAT
jgi:hypothetical protein